eukprot:4690253-Prymnesium_polylepis.1
MSWPWTHAYLSAVKPIESTLFTSAPASNRRSASRTLPFKQALRIASDVLASSSSSTSAQISKSVWTLCPRLRISAS